MAYALAHPGAEIVAIDAMQVYRGMDIGTAKPSPADRQAVPHHCLDLVAAGDDFNVANFAVAAGVAIEGIAARGGRAVLVAGTGLYLRSVTDPMEIPGRWPEVRAGLEQRVVAEGSEILHSELSALDPLAASRMEPSNTRQDRPCPRGHPWQWPSVQLIRWGAEPLPAGAVHPGRPAMAASPPGRANSRPCAPNDRVRPGRRSGGAAGGSGGAVAHSPPSARLQGDHRPPPRALLPRRGRRHNHPSHPPIRRAPGTMVPARPPHTLGFDRARPGGRGAARSRNDLTTP